MTKITLKRIIVGCSVFFIGLMTMVTLCVPLFRVIGLNSNVTDNITNLVVAESGFSLLDGKSAMGMGSGAVAAVCVLAWFQLFLAIATMALSVLTVFLFETKTAKRILLGLSIACIVFIGAYMLVGIIANVFTYPYMNFSFIGDSFNEETLTFELSNRIGGDVTFDVITLAYIGFIIGAVLFVVYMVLNKVVKNDKPLFAKAPVAATPSSVEVAETSENAAGSRFCEECGARLAPDSKFCENCGKPVGGEAVPPPVETETVENTAPQDAVTEDAEEAVDAHARRVAQALKEYKELFDMGILTQDEFDAKKKELLK